MRLTVLGGSAAGPNPGQGCSGYHVEASGARLVLDLGPGTLPELRRHADFRTLDAVVISHLHLDHVLDLAALRFALAHNPVRPAAPIPLWMPPNGRAFLDRLAAVFAESGKEAEFFPSVFQVAEYDPAQPLTIAGATLTFTPTVHYVPCWAIRVSTGQADRDLAYTADTGPAATGGLAAFATGAAVLIAEATNLEPLVEPRWTTSAGERGHLTAAEAAALARDAGAMTLVLSHLWEEFGFERYRAKAAAIFPGRLEIARPGLTVEW